MKEHLGKLARCNTKVHVEIHMGTYKYMNQVKYK